MKPLAAGDLRHRLTLEKYTQTDDGMGGKVSTWNPVATVWGEVKPIRGDQPFFGMQLLPDATHTVRTRYRIVTIKDHRFVYDGRVLSMLGVYDVEERHIALVFMCKEVQT